MGKVLIATFDDKEETTFDELLSFLKSKSHIKVLNTFPNDSYLRYDNLMIDVKYRMVERWCGIKKVDILFSRIS